ncbi:MAG: hypothetical protein ILP13_00770 [Lachnospiraceae bacterium]|nr:hypothetical protein [Lachnospiraceae bacterium]
MTNKGKKLLVIFAAFLVLVSVIMLIAPKHNYFSVINNVVEVKDGVADPGKFKTSLTVNTAGTYTFTANWWREDITPGFVTGLIVTDASGKVYYNVTGGKLYSDSIPMKLEKGRYTFSFVTLGSHEAYEKYVNEHFKDTDIGDIDKGFFHDGTWEMKYRVEINQYMKGAYAIGVGAGAVLGILIIALVVVLSRKENAPVKKYDERQVAAQGKAYKYGFITMSVCLILTVVSMGMKISIPAEPELLMILCILLGGAVTVTNLIWDDAYFRMDENRTMWIVFFSLLSVLNLGIGITRIVRQELFADGVLTFAGSVNLICGVFMVYLLAVILIKSIRDRNED